MYSLEEKAFLSANRKTQISLGIRMTALTGSIGILIAFFLLVKEHLVFQKKSV